MSLPGTAHRGSISWLRRQCSRPQPSCSACEQADELGWPQGGDLAYQLIFDYCVVEVEVGKYLATGRNGKVPSYLELGPWVPEIHPAASSHLLHLRSSRSLAFPPLSEASGLLHRCQES